MKDWTQLLGARLGTRATNVRALAGGDISRAYHVRLADRRECFVKLNDNVAADFFEVEAEGLQWLEEAHALRVPRVLAVMSQPAMLVLEYLEPASRCHDFSEQLGAGLARLHRCGAPAVGWHRDNYIGTLPQANDGLPSWVEFYAQRRLEPHLRRATDERALPPPLTRRLGEVIRRLGDWLVEPSHPERLHGDLWSGNVHVDGRGQPVILDPAVYAGHGEVDLAMLQLFGGLERRVLDAYTAVAQLETALPHRLCIYQLYPLLVHVNLFGGSYINSLNAKLQQVLGR